METGGQYKFKLNEKKAATVTTGFNSQISLKLDENEHEAKVAGGFKINGRFLSGAVTANADMHLSRQLDGIKLDFAGAGLKTSLGFSIKDFRSQMNASATITPTDKKENKLTFTSSLNVKAQFRFCSLRVHLEFQV